MNDILLKIKNRDHIPTDSDFAPLGCLPVARPITANIPTILKTQLPWCLWKAEPELVNGVRKCKANGREVIKKAPRGLQGNFVRTNDASTWAKFEPCVAALETGGFSGLGVLMMPESGLVGIDLDDVMEWLDADQVISALMLRAREEGIYCETSPSGNGLRLFVQGSKDNSLGKKAGKLEMYSDRRHLTVTGHTFWQGEVKHAQWLVDAIQTRIQELQKPTGKLTQASANVTSLNGADRINIDEIPVSQIADWAASEHPKLWKGEWQISTNRITLHPGYPSQSEADMALISHIARRVVMTGVTTPLNVEQYVQAVFKKSGLFRPNKWATKIQHDIPKAVTSALASSTSSFAIIPGGQQGFVGRGDIHACAIFAAESKGKLLYVHKGSTWLGWDGFRWHACTRGEEMEAAKQVAKKLLVEAHQMVSDPDKHRKDMQFALQMQAKPRLDAMVQLAKSESGMSVSSPVDFDANPMLLCVRNGVVDLTTGTLLVPDAGMLLTRQIAANYLPEAKCPTWLGFLEQVFQGDQATVAFIQRAIGYSISGSTTEEVMFICYGYGANGKSVFANILSRIFDDYCQTAPSSILVSRKDGDASPRNDLARLCGVRLVQVNELNQGDRLDEQVVKLLAGREKMTARHLYQDFFEFWPTAKAWLRTNHRPIVTGDDDGIWRRIMLIPFARRFSEVERDPDLEQKLMQERDGILSWIIQGCLDWQTQGLAPSPLVRREVATYRTQSDLLGEFLLTHTVTDPLARVEEGTLFYMYRLWNKENGTLAGSKVAFTRKLSERNIGQSKSNGKRFYVGLSLLGQGIAGNAVDLAVPNPQAAKELSQIAEVPHNSVK